MSDTVIQVDIDILKECSQMLGVAKESIINTKTELKNIKKDVGIEWRGPASNAFSDRVPQILDTGDIALTTIASLRKSLDAIAANYEKTEVENQTTVKNVDSDYLKPHGGLMAGDIFSD